MSLLTWDYDGDLYCVLTTETGAGEDRTTHVELSEARMVATGAPAAPASPAPGPAAVTVVVYAPEEEKPAEVVFDGAQTVPFAVLERFVATVAARGYGIGWPRSS
ncbi:hypothetical protein [Actinacidiphila bryophytorum]|uniref:hypothetical protein n=1 Tax=Actinacidiphila bryophytorum TaxID=1436133 RepID=UPI002176C7FE|nr:hypothetical protein [Actinacidiphila bryophytorum]UWE10737.1 hypothetical protein NYE86_19810 [Actinacidiphila bryophytorum]